jgi:zinc transport system substrate-binding protein
MLKNHDDISIYKPKIKQLNTIKKYINIYFTFNLKWEKRYINDFKNINKNLKIIQLIDFDKKDYDEYRWLDPFFVKDIAKKIYNNMIDIDPKNKDFYSLNYGKFLDQLDQAYISIKNRTKRYKSSKVFVFNDNFNSFFNRFNLKKIDLKFDKNFLTTKEIISMKKLIKEQNIKAILLMNNQYKQKAMIISRSVGIKVINIDMFGYNWLININKISEAFK